MNSFKRSLVDRDSGSAQLKLRIKAYGKFGKISVEISLFLSVQSGLSQDSTDYLAGLMMSHMNLNY